jgi:DNA repair protein RadC
MAKGAAALSDLELLQIIIGSGNKKANVSYLAGEVCRLLRQQSLEPDKLLKIKGLSTAKVTAVMAAMELGKRLSNDPEPIISDPSDIIPLVAEYAHKKQEHLLVFTLDGAGHLLARRLISIGTLTNTLVHPREVFADAITDRAAAIILAHNHPSGDATPSKEDKQVTKLLVPVGDILGISVQDHIIVAGNKWTSLRQQGSL